MGRAAGAVCRGLLVLACGLASGRARADAGLPYDASPGAGHDASGKCESSGDCAAPLAYCHPSLRECVQCLSNRNCGEGKYCDEASGTCSLCRSDDDCPSDKPYCDGAKGCVECKSNANCASYGVACYDGTCGKCGDGICGPREQLEDFGSNLGPSQDPFEQPVNRACRADCLSSCPSAEARLNEPLELEFGSANNWTLCSRPDSPDLTVAFKAPHTGNFFVAVESQQGPYLSGTILKGGCDTLADGCGSLPESIHMVAAETVVLVIEAVDPGTLRVTITDKPTRCTEGLCTAIDAGTKEQGKAACLANAKGRGDAICDGLDCACDHCAQNYGDCALIPGCTAILACMHDTPCAGEACAAPCKSVIGTYGGVRSRAFEAAQDLQSCALTFSCGVPCADGGGAPRSVIDGGAGVDAGDASMPGPEPKHDDSGCDCNVGTTSPHGSGLAMAASLGIVIARRRRRRRSGVGGKQ